MNDEKINEKWDCLTDFYVIDGYFYPRDCNHEIGEIILNKPDCSCSLIYSRDQYIHIIQEDNPTIKLKDQAKNRVFKIIIIPKSP